MEIRKRALTECMVNYLYDNSLLYSHYRKYGPKMKNAKKCSFEYNRDMEKTIINYMLLIESRIEKKNNKNLIKEYENGELHYSELSISIRKETLRFNNKIMRMIYSDLNNYINNSLNDCDNDELLNYFNKVFNLSYNHRAKKIINNIVNDDVNGYIKSLRILELICQSEIYSKNISDSKIIEVKKQLVEKYLHNDELYEDIINELNIIYKKRKKAIIKPYKNLNTNKTIQKKNMIYINKISIISSSHNHATLHHDIENISVLIDFNNGNNLVPLQFNIHYCKDCNVFFDYKDSFYSQNVQYNHNNLIINIIQITNSKGSLDGKDIRLEESLLSKLGYHVGSSGISRQKRRNILKYSIESGLFTVSELKSHLEFCINYFKNKQSMKYAIEDWCEDLQYIAEHQNEFDCSNRKYID